MAPTYRTKDGYTVEVVQLSDTSGNHDGEWLRVSYHGYHVADVRSVAELERYFPLGELEADVLAPRRAPGRHVPLSRLAARARPLASLDDHGAVPLWISKMLELLAIVPSGKPAGEGTWTVPRCAPRSSH